MKKHFCLTCLILVFLLGPQSTPATTRPPPTTDVTLKWDRNPEPDIAGYTVYYGLVSGVYTFSETVTKPTATIEVKNGAKVYFAVTAFDSTGLESEFSDEVRWP